MGKPTSRYSVLYTSKYINYKYTQHKIDILKLITTEYKSSVKKLSLVMSEYDSLVSLLFLVPYHSFDDLHHIEFG